MEVNVEEAVTNNVLGTQSVVEAALQFGTSRLVLISTDKAVEPVSVMGATKRLAESIVRDAARRSGRAFSVVRFGNVLGSRGSIVPIFKRQIASGGPVTVTHPEMRRFFMTIPEAVHLVLQAASMGDGGETFVLRMGDQIRIVDLAKDLIRLSGLEPDKDIRIVFTGVRAGEKLSENFWEDEQDHQSTAHPDVLTEKVLLFEAGSAYASAPAMRTGRCGGRQPAITPLIASFSTVIGSSRFPTVPTTCSRGSSVPRSISSTSSAVGGTTGSPSVAPCS
jgi:FlaA1/EpsC-like NDP-sugar epimerase